LIYDRKSAANVPQIPGGVTDRRRTTDGRCNPALLRPQMGYILGGVTDKHWSMIKNLRHLCHRFLVVWLTDIDLWLKICGIRAADSWWCDWQTLIYDRKSAAFVPQIPGGVTDKHWSMIKNLRHSCRRFLVVWLTDIERQTDGVTPPFSVPK
jgi:hypothetical protein